MLLACSEHSDAPTEPVGGDGVTVVTVRDYAFAAPTITIDAGKSVRWRSTTGTFHTITPDGHQVFAERQMNASGETFEVRFDTPGRYKYYLHRAPVAWDDRRSCGALRDPGMRTLLRMFLVASAAASLPVFASDGRIETRVDARIRVTVAAIYDSLGREGITGEPLVQYALEGTGKRGNPEVILAGVRRWATDLRRSRRILGPNATPNEISSGAKALRAGVSEKQLQGVRETKGDKRFALAAG